MAKMSDSELIAIVGRAEQDATLFNGAFMAENTRYLKEYLGRPYGDEVKNQSSVVSTDVADVVESDMPSLARVFMGSGDILTFEPNTDNLVEVQEAKEKTQYVNWIVRNQPESFKMLHNWIKDAEIQKNGVVKYFIDDQRNVETVEYTGVDQTELDAIVESLQGADVDKVEITSQFEDEDAGTFDIKFRVTHKPKGISIINVPPESFLITKAATSIDDAVMVGDRIRKTRGELIAEGFPRDLVEQLPTEGERETQASELPVVRNMDQGGANTQSTDIDDWAGQSVEVRDMYMKIDYDGDGISERRHIMKSGNVILINEPFDHVPYASLSAILIPHKAIGRSRAEITSSTQRQKTALLRGMLNNIYMVNNPRNVVHPDVDLDDMLTVRTNGIVRLKDNTAITPQTAVMPLSIPYIGTQALQVLQYVDQARAQTTGALLANQGLDSDAIGRETATRFEGVEKAGEAKIELIARNYAETGFRKLYEGIAWLVSRFQDDQTEFRVLGKALTVNPKVWKYNHYVTSSVGLGAGNNEKLVASLQGIYAIQNQLKDKRSTLVDDSDIYSSLKRIVDGLGLPSVDEFFNNPEVPEEVMQAQNEQLQLMVQQLQQQLEQMANPLAEAERIKQEAFLVKAQADAQIKVAQLQEDQRQFNIQTAQNQEQFQATMTQDAKKDRDTILAKLTEMELKFNQNVPGSAV